MRKLISAIGLTAMLLLAGHASAQFSIQAGYLTNEHNVNFQAQGEELMQNKAAWMQGGFIGLTENLPMFANISLAPGVYVSFSQVKDMLLVNADSTAAVRVNDTSASASDLSLKIPFYFNLKFGRFFIFGGPTFNVSLSTIKNMESLPDISKIHYEMGASVGAGVRFGAFRIYAGYNAGLIDRENFDYSNRQAWAEAWEGSSFTIGSGIIKKDTHHIMVRTFFSLWHRLDLNQ